MQNEFPVVTKYFSKESRQFYCDGSFKLGTLREYRSVEDTSLPARFSDKREGLLQRQFRAETSSGPDGVINIPTAFPFCSVTAIGWGTAPVIRQNIALNDHIFCASLGPYDRDHHKVMIDGTYLPDGTFYEGNPDLTEYAVICVVSLLAAINTAYGSHHAWKAEQTGKGDFPLYGCGRVRYGETSESHSDPDAFSLIAEPTFQQHEQVLFTKPAYFEPEKELRIAVFLNAPLSAEHDAEAQYFCNDFSRGAILQMGSIS